MIEIILGKFEPFNKYILENKAENYLSPLIITKNSIKSFSAWAVRVTEPIIGDKILVVIYERDKLIRRDFDYYYTGLEKYIEHPYLDIVWIIEEPQGNYNEMYLQCGVINLKKTRTDDLRKYANMSFDDSVICEAFLEKINYSWKLYNLYCHKLLNIQTTRPLALSDIDNNIEVERTLPPHEILFKLLERGQNQAVNQAGAREYYKLVHKYSLTWVNQHLKELLEDVIELKIKYYTKESIKIRDMMAYDKTRNLVKLVTEIPSYRAYNLLTIFRESDNPVEAYMLHRNKYIENMIGTGNMGDFFDLSD